MTDTSIVADRYDIFDCGTFWDLALLFGFSNPVDGDSFESTPLPETKRSHTLSLSSHLDLSWSTLYFDEDELTSSRNKDVLSPISFDRVLASEYHFLDNEELFHDQIIHDLSSNKEFHISEVQSLGGLILESSFSEEQSPDWIVMGSILDDSSRQYTPEPEAMSESFLHSLKRPCVTTTPENENLSAMSKKKREFYLENLQTSLTLTSPTLTNSLSEL